MLCLVHCLAFPTFAALAPYAARRWGSWACCTAETSFGLHVLILLLATPVGAAAWLGGVRRHGRWGVALLGAAGLALLALALAASPTWLDGQGESLCTLAGSVLVAAAHLWNRDETVCCEHASGHALHPNGAVPLAADDGGVQPAGENRRAA